MNRLKSTRTALENYFQKQLKTKKSRPKNKAPEKDVEKECVAYMNALGWSVEIYSAKATYDPRRGVYRNQSMKAGVVDCQGADAEGRLVCIEFKAPGRLKTFNQPKNYRQKEYLINKINHFAFGCVTDSLARLILIYETWRELLTTSREEATLYLLKRLP